MFLHGKLNKSRHLCRPENGTKTFLSFASLISESHMGNPERTSECPTMNKLHLALVNATFSLRVSLRNPIDFSFEALTQEKMMTSFS